MAAIKALQQWCRIQCDGYHDVAIVNMTTSFRDGLAFCALIHKFRPDLINFEALSKNNVYENNHLAFRVAEDQLGIPALLDAEDMVALPIPDRLSILTYVSQYYNYFNGRSPAGGVGGVKRPAEGSKEEPSEKKNLPVVAKTYNPKALPENRPHSSFAATKTARENRPPCLVLSNSAEKHVSTPLTQKPSFDQHPVSTHIHKHFSGSVLPISKTETSPKPDRAVEKKTVLVENTNKTGTLNSKCTVCKSHVHLVQRHLVDGKLYHRSCFKCAKCSAPLQSGAYKTGHEPETLLCSSHSCTQNGRTSLPKSLDSESAEVGRKSENGSGSSPPQHVSVLSRPIKAVSRPADPRPASQPWTPSAQRTQAARQRFFLSLDPVPQPSASIKLPLEPTTPQNNVLVKSEEEKDRARALITKKLTEGNCNNNNRAYSSGLRTGNSLGDRRSSGEVPGWKQEKLPGSAASERRTVQPPPSPTTANTSSKESLWLSAISKEHTRPPCAPHSIARASSKDVGSCKEPADWQSKLKATPNGPRLNCSVAEAKADAEVKTSEKTNQLNYQNVPPAPVSSNGVPPASNTTCPVVDHSANTFLMSDQSQHGTSGSGFKKEINVSDISSGGRRWLVSCSSVKPLSLVISSPGKAHTSEYKSSISSSPKNKTPPPVTHQRVLTQSSCGSGSFKGFLSHQAPLDVSLSSSESCKSKSPSHEKSNLFDSVEYGSENGSSTNSLITKTISPTIKTHHIPMEQITKELQEIEDSLNDLEKEGIDLERRLRTCEEEGSGDILMDPLMVDWFNLIRKKQCSIRRESELMYIVKTQDLEEQQPGVEGELRRLINKPEHIKSPAERKREAYLMNRLVEIVNDRNAIVEGLEEDRLREEEEDQQLNEMMQQLGIKKLKSKRKSSISKLFRRRSKKTLVEG